MLRSQTITKWELALDSSFSTIRKVITESIGPAIERVMLLLEELHGWALAKYVSPLAANSAPAKS